jgi:4-amino-4-deoxychorismate lyase
MYPLFETIRYNNGVAENLLLHQQRVDNALMQLGAQQKINLSVIIKNQPNKPTIHNQVYKCRISYDLVGNSFVQFEPYTIKSIQSISVHDIGSNEYAHKYSDRKWINNLMAQSGTDEVLFTQNGFFKDASYANLVFYDGKNWITPSSPLLLGTRRAKLLQNGIIKHAPIQLKDLSSFSAIKFINAMMLWEESPIIDIAWLNNQGIV